MADKSTDLRPEIIAYAVSDDTAVRLSPGSGHRAWMRKTPSGFARRCLPLLIANQQGWTIETLIKVDVVWDGSQDRDSVTVVADGNERFWPVSHFGSGILTWQLPYLFRTSSGIDLSIRGPANFPRDGISPLEGIVETDWSPATATMNWQLTRPGVTITFDPGDPIAMIVPVPRGLSEQFSVRISPIDSNPELKEEFKNWADRRDHFIVNREQAGVLEKDQWEMEYVAGKIGNSEPNGESHRRRLRLQQF